MARCRHCGREVEDYGKHLPMCPAVRTAFDDSYPIEMQANHYHASEAVQAAGYHERLHQRKITRDRSKRGHGARPFFKIKEQHMPAPTEPTASPESQSAEYCRDSADWIGAYPGQAQVDGELVIDVAPFNMGDNMPAPAPHPRQQPGAGRQEPIVPQARGPAEPKAAGALA